MSFKNSVHNSAHIIIVTYNAMPYLQKCLASCKQYKVVVVDNNSTDGTVGFVSENFPEVHLIPQTENLGFGQANNLGIKYALDKGAEYVFLLNQDAYLQEGCLKRLIALSQKNLEYGILSPIHFNGEGNSLDKKFLLYLNRYKLSESLLYDSFTSNLLDIYPIEFVNAAGWFISRSCLEVVGGFDPLFFHYGEDRNYCQRVNYHGYKIGIVHNAILYHDRENRTEKKIKKYSEAYYKEFERYLKVDWADINFGDFEKKYEGRRRYLLSKRKHFLVKFQFQKAKDCQIKSKLMLELKANIEKSRILNTEKQMPYLK